VTISYVNGLAKVETTSKLPGTYLITFPACDVPSVSFTLTQGAISNKEST